MLNKDLNDETRSAKLRRVTSEGYFFVEVDRDLTLPAQYSNQFIRCIDILPWNAVQNNKAVPRPSSRVTTWNINPCKASQFEFWPRGFRTVFTNDYSPFCGNGKTYDFNTPAESIPCNTGDAVQFRSICGRRTEPPDPRVNGERKSVDFSFVRRKANVVGNR